METTTQVKPGAISATITPYKNSQTSNGVRVIIEKDTTFIVLYMCLNNRTALSRVPYKAILCIKKTLKVKGQHKNQIGFMVGKITEDYLRDFFVDSYTLSADGTRLSLVFRNPDKINSLLKNS